MLIKLTAIEIDCTSAKVIRNVEYAGKIPINILIDSLLNKSRIEIDVYHKPSFSLSSNFIQIMNAILDDIKQLIQSGDFLLSRNTSDAIFNACTLYWQKLIANGQLFIAKEFWRRILDLVIEWEIRHRNRIRIHKGTPYFFLTHTCLLLDDIENTFIYLSKTIEEDKRICHRFGQNYLNAPAYSTISLSANQNNFMYPKVEEVRNYLQERLRLYNRKLRKKVKFSTIERKFFRNKKYTDPMIFLNFFIHIIRIQEDSIEKLNNDFSKMRMLNLMFGICLIIDKTLWIRFSKSHRYIPGNIKSLCLKKGWCSNRNDAQVIWDNVVKNDFESNRTTDFENIIDTLLDFQLKYNGNFVRKEIQILFLLWGLRNQGAHRLEKQNILIRRYKDIIQALMNAFFMSTY